MDRVEATGAEPNGVGPEPAEPASDNPFAAMDPEMAANPQPVFRMLRETMPVVPIEGVGVALSRKADIDAALRQPGIFSSNIDAVDLGNIRPLIPLQIDPPDQKKYRKLLDPIFAPRQVALLEGSITQLVNDLIDRIVEHDAVDFATSFSVPFPSQVFLTLLGLPLDELPTFLTMKDGIIRPDAVTGEPYGSEAMREYQRGVAASVYTYFDQILDRRQERRHDDLLSRLLDAEVEGAKLSPRGDPRHLLPVPHRRVGHGDRHLGLHVRLLGQPPPAPPGPGGRPGPDPRGGRGAVALGDAGHGRRAGDDRGHRGGRLPRGQGSDRLDAARIGQHRRSRVRRRRRRPLRPRGQPSPRLRRRGAPLPGLEPGSTRAAGRPREWHRRIPEYSVAEGHTLVYTPGIRSIEHFPMVLSAAP